MWHIHTKKLFSNLKKQKELLASHEEILVTLKYILLRNSVWKVYILLTLWKLSDILEKWTIEMRGWKNCTWSTGKQESETIMYKTIIVGTWHYVFFKPHITVKNKEWILIYTKKKFNGSRGIPGWKAECDQRINTYNKYIAWPHWRG